MKRACCIKKWLTTWRGAQLLCSTAFATQMRATVQIQLSMRKANEINIKANGAGTTVMRDALTV